MSDSNLQTFYEKDGLSVKAASWRDALIGVDQTKVHQMPQYAKEFGQIDASINYDLNDDLTVFFDGVNQQRNRTGLRSL